MPHCLNCNTPFDANDGYCNQCGQKTAFTRLTLWTILKDFFSNLFNIESKLFLTLKDLYIPAKLALCYIGGKRAVYYNPVRMFLIVLALMFTLIFFLSSETIDQSKSLKNKMTTAVNNSLLTSKIDSFAIAYQLDQQLKFCLIDELAQDEQLPNDSININISNLTISGTNPDFNAIEFASHTPEYLIAKYDITDKFSQLGIIQVKKFLDSPSESIRYIIGNGTWVIIVTILLLSLFYFLIYRNYFYAEHVIFHIIGHTRILLTSCLLMIINSFALNLPPVVIVAALMLIGSLYLYKDMRVMYEQTRIVTMFKFVASAMAYLFIIIIVFTLTSLISFYIL